MFQMNLLLVALAVIFLLCTAKEEKLLHRLAFGSCYNAHRGGEIWAFIESLQINNLILLGDQIYADFKEIFRIKRKPTPEILINEYKLFTENTYWQKLINNLRIKGGDFFAVYDDHDYGINNGDKTFLYRNETQDIFGEHFFPRYEPFLEEGEVRKSGVYSSHNFNIDLQESDSNQAQRLRMKLILLDGRTNKDVKGSADGDFLGDQQWKWFDHQLELDDFDLLLIGTGIQILPDEKLLEESWGEFPNQRRRLLNSIANKINQGKNVFFLTGDVHCAEISKVKCGVIGSNEEKEEIEITEFTSSGLSHSFIEMAKKKSKQELELDDNKSLPSIIIERNPILKFVQGLYQIAYPGYYRERKFADFYDGMHVSLLDIVQEGAKISLVLRIISQQDKREVITRHYPLNFPTVKAHESKKDYECIAFHGETPQWRKLVFKATLILPAFFLIIVPILVLLWFLIASIYYICIGQELARRENIERHYQEKQHKKTN